MVMDSRSRKPLQRAMGVGGINRWYITEHAYVKSDAPNTNFGYPTTAVFYEEEGGPIWTAVFKFDRQISPFVSADIIRYLALLAACKDGIQFDITRDEPGLSTEIILIAIRDDFDASTITYNTLSGLTTTSIGGVTCKRIASFGVPQPGWAWASGSTGTGGLIFYRTGAGVLSGAYGLGVQFSRLGGVSVGDFVKIEFEREAVGSNYAGYLELF